MLVLTLRNLVARKGRLAMSALSVVLGIGFLTGVMVFSNGLDSTFANIVRGTTPAVLVRQTGSMMAQSAGAGSTLTLSRGDVARLSALKEVERAVPHIEGQGLRLLDSNGKLVGGQGAPTIAINYTDAPNMDGKPQTVLQAGRLPASVREVTLDSQAAEKAGYSVGDEVQLVVPFGEPLRTATLVGLLDFNGGGAAGAVLITMNERWAQSLFLEGDRAYTSVNLSCSVGVSPAQLAKAARKVLPRGYTAVEGKQIVKEADQAIGRFTKVISIFLLAFAVIAVVVGGTMITNTFSILVAQRVRELALLRALGASRRQVSRTVLLEALVLGLVGSTLGIGLGLLLARLVARLFTSLGLVIASDVLTLSPGITLAALGVGVGVTLASAWLPARQAAAVAPVSAMALDDGLTVAATRLRNTLGWLVLTLGAMTAATGLMDPPGNDAAWIGIGAVLVLLATTAISSVIGRPVLQLCRAAYARMFGLPGQLAGLNALRNPARTGATASALLLGLAIVSSVGVLATSLKATVGATIDDAFTTDYLITANDFSGFPVRLGNQIAALDGVGSLARQQLTGVSFQGVDVWVTGVDSSYADTVGLQVLRGTVKLGMNEAFVDEEASQQWGLRLGSQLPLVLPGGRPLDLTVVGVVAPSPLARGVVVSLPTLSRAGQKRVDYALAINAKPGTDLDELKSRLDALVAPIPIVAVQDKIEFRAAQERQINQLLAVIYGLLALAVVIAVLGIMNTLGLSVLERTREIGMLRALGLSRRSLRLMVFLESIAIATMGAVIGLGIGVVIGVMLRQALAEDLTQLGLPLGSLTIFLFVAIGFGVLSAIAPAGRAARLPVLQAISTE